MEPATVVSIGRAIWNEFKPLAPEKRAARKAKRQAKRKRRRGETLTPEEVALMAGETVKIQLPDGSIVERTEPTIKARTSTKVLGVGGIAMIATAGSFIPFYDEINGVIIQACQSEHGPLAVLAGMGGMLALNWWTARKTKSPIVPGKI